MNVFRRLPLSRLIVVCAAVVALGTGVAVASSIGSGTPPPPESLAQAIHQALAATPVSGVTADVTFTNSLLQDGASAGSSPLLAGGSGRLWVTASGQARLELQSSGGDTEIYYANGTLSYYDPSNGGTLYHVVLPSHAGSSPGSTTASGDTPPTVDAIQQAIDHLMQHASVAGATPSVVAGQPAYEVRVAPSRNGGLFGGAALWWDAAHGVPLQVAVYAVNDPSPVLQLGATSISYGPIDPSVFTPPVAAKVQTIDLSSHAGQSSGSGSGSSAAPPTLSFTPSEPASLDGQTLTSTRLVHWNGHAAELLFYGHGLGGLAVLERQAQADASPTGGGPGDQSGPSLPTVNVNGATATEIPTALGTLVQFTRGGVSYTVVGSVPTADAVRAADGL